MFGALRNLLRKSNYGEACFIANRNLQDALERLKDAKRRGDTRAQHDAYIAVRFARTEALRVGLGR